MEGRQASMKSDPSILIMINWFGPWPAWIELFLESCRWNPSVNFAVFTDAGPPEDVPPNVKIIRTSLAEYCKSVAENLRIPIRWSSAYKLCDIRPALGAVFSELIKGYDFWGYGDMDVVYGNIRRFYNGNIVGSNVVSAHEKVVSGHLALIKNSEEMNSAYRKIRHWKYFLTSSKHKSFDERIFSMLFLGDAERRRRGVHRFLAGRIDKALLVEQYSTSLPGLLWIDGTQNFPTEWYWREGRLTSNASGDREFLYVHFTHWNSDRWTDGRGAAWRNVFPLVKITETRPKAFTISRDGFTAL